MDSDSESESETDDEQSISLGVELTVPGREVELPRLTTQLFVAAIFQLVAQGTIPLHECSVHGDQGGEMAQGDQGEDMQYSTSYEFSFVQVAADAQEKFARCCVYYASLCEDSVRGGFAGYPSPDETALMLSKMLPPGSNWQVICRHLKPYWVRLTRSDQLPGDVPELSHIAFRLDPAGALPNPSHTDSSSS
eukprot:SAG11_NODE_428_length_9551_cov_6.526978_7_plen_192_part_00